MKTLACDGLAFGSFARIAVAVVAILALATFATSMPTPQSGGDGSTGTLNTGTPKKDGSSELNIGYTFESGSGSQQGGTVGPIVVPLNGKPKPNQDPPDAPQTTASGKATLIAAAINEAAKGDDGQANTNDDHPVSATAIGDVVVVLATGTNGTIGDIDVSDGTKEKDILGLTPTPGGNLRGTLELGGQVSGAAEEGTIPTLTVTVGTKDYTYTTDPSDSLADVLDALVGLLAADNVSSTRIRSRIEVLLPENATKFGFESNDRTIDCTATLIRL